MKSEDIHLVLIYKQIILRPIQARFDIRKKIVASTFCLGQACQTYSPGAGPLDDLIRPGINF